MKTRSGVPESRAFGPAMSSETQWEIMVPCVLDPRHSRLLSYGPTAFAACANIGISLGEVVDIRPVTEKMT
jgi:hypothetical protein